MKVLFFNFNEEKSNKFLINAKSGLQLSFVNTEVDLFETIKEKKINAIIIHNTNIEERSNSILKKIIKHNKKIIVIMYSKQITLKNIVSSMKYKAYDYVIASERDEKKLLNLVDVALKNQKLRSKKIYSSRALEIEEEIIGTTEAMVNVYKFIGTVANLDLPVLIIGSTGTGKGIIARAIHKYGNRKARPYVDIKCATLTTELFDSELFGDQIVGNTDDLKSKTGKFEIAEDGVVCFEEIGNMSLEVQAKLLTILQEKKFKNYMTNTEINVNFRIIYTTDKDLETLVKEEKFLEELYHRIRVLKVELPSLAERIDDIPFLINLFIKSFNVELQKTIKGISDNALKSLMKYSWPGNVRELKNVVKSSMAVCRGNMILFEDLPGSVSTEKSSTRHGDIQDWVLEDWIAGEIEILKEENEEYYYNKIISRVERELITQILKLTNSKKVETAKILGITRNTLRTKMRNYGLE